MLLCDIGNTSYHFLDDERSFKESVGTFNPQNIQEKVYYISVNHAVNAEIANLVNWIDISSLINRERYYETMGIDRIAAVEAVENAIVVDAGSAVTVDAVKEGVYMGGFIYPGMKAMQKSYKDISPALDYSFNFELNLDKMPKNSQDAISYGYLKTLYTEVMLHNLPVILTGGDAKVFAKIFKEADVDERLVFKGMKKILQKADRC
ncbi:type III pantothenate kinase [Sulfurimonas paralvinellae]|uniref:Type III pantothenate kinase n=1 Tax=Sulfurimonas paralvinellae TaxID=317658 RepID=A0A7M1B731_9BACT|nr:type III pantothenate kinase [Sulfurimonas paralvinellae]QOP45490.1 type III pantothenate kinase [Sulfurimonas paralvinellae]